VKHTGELTELAEAISDSLTIVFNCDISEKHRKANMAHVFKRRGRVWGNTAQGMKLWCLEQIIKQTPPKHLKSNTMTETQQLWSHQGESCQINLISVFD